MGKVPLMFTSPQHIRGGGISLRLSWTVTATIRPLSAAQSQYEIYKVSKNAITLSAEFRGGFMVFFYILMEIWSGPRAFRFFNLETAFNA